MATIGQGTYGLEEEPESPTEDPGVSAYRRPHQPVRGLFSHRPSRTSTMQLTALPSELPALGGALAV